MTTEVDERTRRLLLGSRLYQECDESKEMTREQAIEFEKRLRKRFDSLRLTDCILCGDDSYKEFVKVCMTKQVNPCFHSITTEQYQQCMDVKWLEGFLDEYLNDVPRIDVIESNAFCRGADVLSVEERRYDQYDDPLYKIDRSEYVKLKDLNRLCYEGNKGLPAYLDDAIISTYFAYLQRLNNDMFNDRRIPSRNRLLCGFIPALTAQRIIEVFLTAVDVPKCAEQNCPNTATHNVLSERIPKYCSEHSKKGMVDKRMKYFKPPKRLFEMDRLFFPVNVGADGIRSTKLNHWVLIMVDLTTSPKPTMYFLDSFMKYISDNTTRYDILRPFLRFLEEQAKAVFKNDPEKASRFENISVSGLLTPQQDNGADCGVYVLRFAEFLMVNMMLIGVDNVTGEHTSYMDQTIPYRKKILATILRTTVVDR